MLSDTGEGRRKLLKRTARLAVWIPPVIMTLTCRKVMAATPGFGGGGL